MINLAVIKEFNEKDIFIIKQLVKGERSIRAIANEHKNYIPEYLYKSTAKLRELNIITPKVKGVSNVGLTDVGLEYYKYFEILEI